MKIIDVDMPPRLALPLPLGARLWAQTGQEVRAGEALAGGRALADVLAPAAAVVGKVARLPVAGENGQAQPGDCLLLENVRPQEPAPLPRDLPPPQLLKRAGIVGLGGGGFPAWRKWRRNLRLFVANAVESDERLSCDQALIAERGANAVVAAAQYVAGVFAAPLKIAAGRHSPFLPSAPAVFVGNDYAAGNERLLLQTLLGAPPPRNLPPADCGYVCFNIATVLAMHDALRHGAPLLRRITTLRAGGRVVNARAPFGVSVANICAAAKLPPPPAAMGRARLAAASALVDLQPPAPPPALPCIRCAACDAVCPAQILPMRLHALLQDNNLTAAARERLPDCLLCKRCDNVCPSAIPLTAQFANGRQALAAKKTEAQQRHSWRQKHERRARRQATQAPAPAQSRQQIKNVVAQILSQNDGG